MKQFLRYALPALVLMSIVAACEKEYESIESIDDKNVEAYIKANNLAMVEYQNSGTYYQVINAGTGPDIEYSDQVPLIFTIKSIDGTYSSVDTFSSASRYYNFLGYFNPEAARIGIKEVLKERSGTIRMVIPSRSAFGRNGIGPIPGNASLDITIRVLDRTKLASYDDFNIQKYLTTNSLTGFSKTNSGIYYKIDAPGTGSPITADSTIKAEYEGKFLNGNVFQKTDTGSPVSFSLKEGVIPGWREVVPFIKEGGTIRMVLPSASGYGLPSDNGIPAFSCLFFTVKVTEVSQ